MINSFTLISEELNALANNLKTGEGVLKAQSEPKFIAPLVDAKIEEGGKFVFECLVTGNPVPKISWRKENIPVESNPDYLTKFDEDRGLCSLTIEETFAEDSARYFCVAVNSAGSAETSGFLRVIGEESESPPAFTQQLEDGQAIEGGTFEFRCQVTGFPLPNVSWFKGETCVDHAPDYSITYNNGNAALRLEKVYLEDHGLFSVRATNRAGSSTCSAFLEVHRKF